MVNQNYNLSSLEIENFRQYHNTVIKFSQDPKKMFTIIRGANGEGKTNIMNAITWCLYGKEKHLDDHEKDLPIINTRILKENPGKLVNMRVTLVLADTDGDKFRIERKLTLLNNGTDDNMTYDKQERVTIPHGSTPAQTTSFQFYNSRDGGWKTTEYFDKSVEDLLPEDLATYFLFDGEKLEEFFEQKDSTKKGIEDVSQIKVMDNAIETLDKIIRQKSKSAKDLKPQAQIYQQKMDTTEDQLKIIKNKKLELNQMIQTITERITEIESTIEGSGGDVGELQKDANNIRLQISKYRKQCDDAEYELREYVLEQMPGILMHDIISKTLTHIDDKTKKGVLPPKIRDTFIQELLNRNECICGNDISIGEPRMRVSSLLRSAQYSRIDEICSDLKYKLTPLLSIDEIENRLKNKQREIFDIKKSIKNCKEEFDNYEIKIKRAGGEDARKLVEEKNDLRDNLNTKYKNEGALSRDESELEANFTSFKSDYEKELGKSYNHRWLNRQLKFCNSASDGLKKIKKELLEDVRKQVEEYTKKYFLKFLWKKDTYDGVSIRHDYKITAHHVDGHNVRTSLSKGEKLVLALSFMAALRKITGFGFPLLIDTPFGRVSGESRHNIAQHLPEFLKNTQVTLLVTDSEYQAEIKDDYHQQKFPPIRNTIEEYVGQDYNIRFSKGKSVVVSKT